ncbi:MAG: FtsX-like permease family protein [Acidimicrobiia bacterium]|nr:FtsX-like permease family protein [Acidimicrobiia bacterium]MDH3397353.1 FtsX-like permease family protein [Acidimicrobiia bacterium]
MSTLRTKLRRDLGRQKAQFAAITITVFLGITMFGASYDSFQNLEASYAQTATEFSFANLTLAGGDVVQFATDSAGLPGVEAVSTRTVADLPFRLGDTKLLGRVVGIPESGPIVNQVLVLEGSDPTGPNSVLMEEHLAAHFDITPGDTFEIQGPSGWMGVEIAGIISSPEYIWPAASRQEVITTPDNFGVVFAPQSTAAALSGEGNPNEAVVYYNDGHENEALTESLTTRAYELGALETFTRAEQPSNAALEEDLAGFEEMGLFFPILFLSAAAMAAYVMITRLVHAQRPQIGILLANGFTKRQVLRHYLGYGIVPGLIGSIPGAIAGVLLARVITGLYTTFISVPITVIRFYPSTLFAAIALGLLATLVAAAAPALAASRLSPAESMRGSVPTGKGRASLAERLLPPLRRLPIRWRMTLRGIERNPRRTIYTVIGVVLSLTLVLVSWGMLDTIEHLMDRQFVQIQKEDARVYFTTPVGAADLAALADIAGVAGVEPSLELPIAIEAKGERYETLLVAIDADTEMHTFYTGTDTTTTLPTNGVLAGIGVADQLNIAAGDAVSVTVGGVNLTLDTHVTDFIDEPLGSMVYISESYAEELAGIPLPATSALLTYEEGASSSDIRNAIVELPQVAAFEDAKAIYNIMQDYMALFYVFIGVMLAFGAAMAFALIFNTMSVNIAERSREVATLLAVGTKRRTISRLITTENLLVAAIGIPLGLVAGYLTSAAAMASFQSDMFRFELYVRPSTFVWSAVAILIVALISQWPGLRAVRRMDIASVVKERST